MLFGGIGFGIDCTEEAAGNGIVPAHAVEQPAGGEVRTGPGSDLATRSARLTVKNKAGPPAWPAMKTNAVSTSGKPSCLGQTIAGVDLHGGQNPGNQTGSTVASKMLRRGLWASSDRVEMPSKPMYVSIAIEVPVETAFHEKVAGS